jgi:hypothetical protein
MKQETLKQIITHSTILLISVIITLLFYSEIIKFPGFFVEDDTFFYAQIAYNIGVNGISSFDGLNTTDGYHLIWCWILSAFTFITKFFTLDKHIHFIIMLSFYHYLIIWLSKILSKNIPQAIISFFILIVTAYLMEDVLLSLLIVITIRKAYNKNFDYFYWLLLFFIPLVRIDSILIIGSFTFFFLLKEYKRLIYSLLTIVAGSFTQLFINKLIFDSYFSVSSLIKLDQSRTILENLTFNINDSFYFSTILALVLFFSVVMIYIITINQRKSIKGYNFYYFVLIISAFLYFVYLYTYIPFIRQWYLTPIKALSLFILFEGDLLSFLLNKIKYFWHVASAIIIIGFLYFYSIKLDEINSDNIYTWQFLNKIKEVVPKGEKIYQVDASGITGYFSERNIINGDGLVNSHQYFELQKKRKLDSYLKSNNIKYIITNRRIKNKRVLFFYDIRITSKQVQLLIEPDRFIFYDFCYFGLYRILEEDID